MDPLQAAKAAAFQALHKKPGAFVIPNPWDRGTARMLAALGYEALATTSAGLSFTLGRRDSERAVSRDETFANAAEIASVTALPVSADLENGFGDAPEAVAQTIRLSSATGIVGASIEDASGKRRQPIYDFTLAVERIAAAAEAARSLPFPFCLTARAENFQFGRPDIGDTIRRLQAYAEAGADVLYAPALPNLETIRRVCASVEKPVNIVIGVGGPQYPVAALADAGVKRISLGSALIRAALGGFLKAAGEVQERGTFSFVEETPAFAEVANYMAGSGDGP
ncbi:MAG TPA: isocitrate lyase/phosphoenolpyruvate mutase family protein [Stellaceae bacterium]|nr:isocitrate lyase/phosphoenolpyruvate mutase family protein [Stellaceae bacterium]